MKNIIVIGLLSFFFIGCDNKTIPTKIVVSTFEKKLNDFEDFVEAEMKKNKTPGLTIAFIKDDYMWAKGFGYADIENKTLMKAESAFRMASVQKSMTATAILTLVEQGKMNLDDEVQKYVPYFPKKKYPITIRELLGHLGGITHYVNRPLEQHFKEHKGTRESIAVFENFDLVAEPGTKYNYSSYGYNLLGAAIEGASKMSYSDYMKTYIWNPAGMSDMRLDDPLDIIPNRVRGYQFINKELKNSEFIDISSRFAAGGTRGTVIDLVRFMKALNDGKLLKKENTKLMYESMVTKDGTKTGYGMGWNEIFQKSGLVVINDGGQQETRTFILNFPEKRFCLAICENLELDTDGALIFRLYELVLGEKFVLSHN